MKLHGSRLFVANAWDGAQEDLGFLVLGYPEVRVCLGFCMPVLPDFLEFTRKFRAPPTLGG